MGCCGGSRRTVAATSGARVSPALHTPSDGGARVKRLPHAYFQYSGRTALTVVGPVSGRRYRFSGPGQVVAVDPADRRALASVPHLRQVAGP